MGYEKEKDKYNEKVFYLENTQGQVVRSIFWSSERLYVLYRHDLKRVELAESTQLYTDRDIQFDILETVTRYELESGSRLLAGTDLRLVTEAEKLLPQVTPSEDREEDFNLWLRRTSLVAAGLVALLFSVNVVMNMFKNPEPKFEIVQVIDRTETPPPIQTHPVTPSKKDKKIVQPPQRRIMKRVAKNKTPRPQVSQRGALGVLGSLSSSSQRGGLEVDSVGRSRGIGRGGGQTGSGGIQTSIYSKGMFAAPLGAGNNPEGAGGYGTKGKGGGQAGYGKLSLAGSSQAYFEPVASEAWIEGGLDPNEIAAVIKRHESQVRACYERGLQKSPKLAGRLSMRFLIGPQGRVTTAKVSQSSLGHAGVESCIQSHLMSWKFPRPEGGVTVKVAFPFVLGRVSGT
jgi:outer membrane biosynthesis protein TonB